jgi:ABC-2 type transport system ATP-binding protein
MSEMAQTADHLIVIGRGKLLADVSTKEFIESSATNAVTVRSPQVDELERLLKAEGVATDRADGALHLHGVTTAHVGDLAAEHQLTVHELYEERGSLEAAFMEMTRDSVDYHAAVMGEGAAGAETAQPANVDEEVSR